MSSFSKKRGPIKLIENIRESQYKMGDLVNWKSPYGPYYMAIIDSVESDANKSTYKIHVIDSAWSDKKLINIDQETTLEKINTHPEYDPDLFINITQDEKLKTMLKLKQAIRALKTNINFIESMPRETFSDLAIRPKIRQLKQLKNDLNNLYNTPNTLDEQTYISFNNKLYGNLIVQISNICDTLGVNIQTKEKIIGKTIQICNCLLSFTGISFGLNIAYYRFYGKTLLHELLALLPDNIKKEIVQLLYTFLSVGLMTQLDALYGACTNIKPTMINIINLFRNQIIQLSNGEIRLPQIEEQPKMIIESSQKYSPESSQDSQDSIESNLSGPRYFEEKCTIGIDVSEFDEEAKEIFINLNKDLNEINDVNDDDFKKKDIRSRSRSRSRDRIVEESKKTGRRTTRSRGGRNINKNNKKRNTIKKRL
jgi:hypothetical protein